jgi:TldD protein
MSRSIFSVVEENGRRESGGMGGGGRAGLINLIGPDSWQPVARANRYASAVKVTEAEPHRLVCRRPPRPRLARFCCTGCGSALGNFNRKGTSAFSGLMGQQIASSVTVLDDGTIPDRRGSITVDDEGTPRQNMLIDDGVLVGLHARPQNARLMGLPPPATAAQLCAHSDAAR